MSSLPPIPAAPSERTSDKLTIETPEQTALEFAIAGVGSRFLALAFDTLIQIVAFLVILSAAFLISARRFRRLRFYLVCGAWCSLGFVLYYGYFAHLRSRMERPDARQTHHAHSRDKGFRPADHARRIRRAKSCCASWINCRFSTAWRS